MSAQLFFGYWQLFFCAFAFTGLMAIYWHLGRKKGDLGQVWLALSVLCWSISGGIEVMLYNHPLLSGWRSILSLLNSFFILLALPDFRYIPNRIAPLIQSRYWLVIIGLPFVFSLLPTISAMLQGQNDRELDVYYATLTLIFLGTTLWTSFARRRLPILAWLSVICILITFTAQLQKIMPWVVNEALFSAIFKSCLIMLFFALALSWVKEMLEIHIPASSQVFIQLSSNGAKRTVTISGIGRQPNYTIPLRANQFELLQRFVQAKLSGEGWLEIRPKNETRNAKSYDINDYNEIKRLLHTLLDGIYGKGSWTQQNHYQPLKQCLLTNSEQRDRKVKLALPVENITLRTGVNDIQH